MWWTNSVIWNSKLNRKEQTWRPVFGFDKNIMSHKFWKPGTSGPGQHLVDNAASAEDRPTTENQSSLNDDLNSTIVFNSNSSLAMDQQRQR